MKFWLYGIAGLALAGLVSVGIHRVYNAGQESVQVKWDAERAIQQKAFDDAAAETARIDAERNRLTQEIENVLKPKLALADLAARDVARELRSYRARLAALSQAAGPAPEPDAAGGIPGDPAGAEEDHFAACARDAERLNGWIEWYGSLPR